MKINEFEDDDDDDDDDVVHKNVTDN